MPGLTIERPKMTRVMYQALKRHIMRDRERKKQEQEHDKAMERQRKERELRKKKEEEDSLTLEQTKEQISALEKRLEGLKGEKHELFSQLKKVLHQEDENRKRAQIKEHNEMLSLQQQYNTAVSAHPMYLQAPQQPRTNKYLNLPIPHPGVAGVKRSRSPTPPPAPPPSSIYPHYSSNKYPVTTSYTAQIKPDTYLSVAKSSNYSSTHVTYASQSGNPYQPSHIPQLQAAAQLQGPPSQLQAPPTRHQTPPSHQPGPSQPSAPSTQLQAPPQPHKNPPSQLQAPPTQHPAPPTQLQGPTTQLQAPPSSHQTVPAQHQAPPSQLQAPPTQHQVPPAGVQAPLGHQAPPTQHKVPTPQHQAPPHSLQGPPQHQSAPQPHPGGPPNQLSGNQSQSGKYPAGQSAFQTYSTHYAHQQKQMTERLPQGYTVQRLPQPGYMEASHATASLSLQQQLEHANQKSGFSEDKFKMQQTIRGVAPLAPQQQAQLLATAQLTSPQPSNQPPPKGSIVTGYPIRTQPNTNYQPPLTQSALSPQIPGVRQNYRRGQSQGRYY